MAYEILEHHKLGFVHQLLTSMRVGNPSIMTSIDPLNIPYLDFVIIANRYAHRFLLADEADALVRDTNRGYFRLLGRSIIELQPRRFWEHHGSGLASIDRRMPWGRIAFNVVRAGAIDLLNPLSMVLKMWRRRQGGDR